MMSKLDIIRAWKDKQYRHGLTREQLALLPGNPAGEVELSESDLDKVDGGTMTTGPANTMDFYCPIYTFNSTMCPVSF